MFVSVEPLRRQKDTDCFVFVSGISLSLIPLHKDTGCFVLFLVFRYRSYPYTKTRTALFCFWYFAIAHTPTQTSARKACLFLYSFPHMRKRKLCGISLSLIPIQETRHNDCAVLSTSADIFAMRSLLLLIKNASAFCTRIVSWSEWRDLNSRPYGPEPYALPNCATPR